MHGNARVSMLEGAALREEVAINRWSGSVKDARYSNFRLELEIASYAKPNRWDSRNEPV